jgi:diguanylate cyclase (GGDEF)-like protein
MSMPSSSPPADSPAPAGGRLPNPRRWRREHEEQGAALVFGVRMFVTVALTLALIGVMGYVLLERSLAHSRIKELASAQQADVDSFERYGVNAPTTQAGIAGIDRLLDAVAHRPGTREAVLIDSHHVIRAAGESTLVGTIDTDPRIDAALEHGRSYAGRESDPAEDRSDFEFVAPVNLRGERYAYEITYDHSAYDAQLREAHRVLILIGLLTLFGGGAVFYLVGGRRLMKDHRMVLRRATRDGLTDLPNQRAFQDEFPLAVAAAMRYRDSLALALLDVDDFKLINDRHGHPHGDAILERVAAVLRESRPGDRPYRIGGDEFALLLAHTDAEGARTLARRLSRALVDAGIEVSIGVSALRPGQLGSPAAGGADTLRAEADTALYEAKRQGGNRIAHFDDIRDRVVVTTSEKKQAVRRLIDEGRLTTVFQPIWNFDAQTLLGVEALTRPDPSYGLSGPAEAFDIAEQIGRVHQLDVLCARRALQAAPQLAPGVLLFLNLSPLTLDLDAEGNDWLRLAVEQAGLSPQGVVIEVTERFGGRTASVVKCLRRLRKQGFQIAVDDVGTGNSGLEMLRKLDAEFVKLDCSIVAAAATEPSSRAVLMAMATFARQTGAFVIAEGIEDEETLQFLRSIEQRDLVADTVIQGGQGFRLGRPSPELSPDPPAMFHAAHTRPHPVVSTR